MIKSAIILFPFLIFSTFLEAKTIFDHYFKTTVRNEQISAISVQMDHQHYRPLLCLEYYRDFIKRFQKELHNGERVLPLVMTHLPIERSTSAAEEKSRRATLAQSLMIFATYDFDKIFSQPDFLKVMKQFSHDYERMLKRANPQQLAVLGSSNPFYRNEFSEKLLKKTIRSINVKLKGDAKKIAQFLVLKTDELVVESFFYHQNMLLHYLEHEGEIEAPLNDDILKLAMISIFESRLSWFDTIASLEYSDLFTIAKEQFLAMKKRAKKKYSLFVVENSLTKTQMNLSFALLSREGLSDSIWNFYDQKSLYDQSPSLVVDFKEPTGIYTLRQLVQAAQLGLKLLDADRLQKESLQFYLKSLTVNQIRSEGGLYFHFLHEGKIQEAELIRKQANNPYIISIK